MTIEIAEGATLDDTWVRHTKEVLTGETSFAKWKELITYTEGLNGGVSKNSSDVDKFLLIKSYENLLDRYPYLEHYWTDFAQWYFKLGLTLESVQIYEKLLDTLPHSLVIWIKYIEFIMFIKSSSTKEVMTYFERARKAIGYHYFSDKFYDLYLSYLWQNELYLNYFSLLRKIIELPIYMYSKFQEKWFKHIENEDLKKFQYIINRKDLQSKYNLNYQDLYDTQTLNDLRKKLRKLFIDMYITTQFHSFQLYQFEKPLLQNHYDPTKPVSDSLVASWLRYLEFKETYIISMTTNQDKLDYYSQVVQLYERCILILPTNNKIWLKFINFEISNSNLDKLIELCIRARLVLRNDSKIILKLAQLYVFTEQIVEARDLIFYLYNNNSQDFEIFLMLLNLERMTQANDLDAGSKLLTIIRKKLANSDSSFDDIFEVVQGYTVISLLDLKAFYIEFNEKTSAKYWNLFLAFLELHYPQELPTYLETAQSRCESVDLLSKKYKSQSWIDEF